MAPRLPPLLLAACLPGACAPTGDEKAAALRLAIENTQASLAATAGLRPAGEPAPILAAATPGAPPLPLLRTGDAGGRPVAAAQLLGAEPATLRRWLGEPSLLRVEGDAEVWLYAGTACALDLVLYPVAGRLHVAHANARANGAEPRTEAHCLQELATGPGATLPAADRGV